MNVILFLLVAFAATPAVAQLKWDNPEQTFAPKPLAKLVVARFRFTNIGTSPVTINGLQTSCGCTTAALEKKEYSPGESGEIEAKFQFAGRIGHQEKWILVTTNTAPNEPSVLRLVVNIPAAITVQPELVTWHVGDDPEPKTIRITVSDEIPGQIVSVEIDNPAVKLELREVRPGKELEVKVIPSTTSEPASSVLSIRTDYPPENPLTHFAYVRVR